MKRRESKSLIFGALFILAFILWTVLIQTVDVKPIPPKPGASGDNVKNGFKVLESIMNVFRNLLKGNNR